MVEMLLKYGADPNDYGTTVDNGRTVRLAALQEASEEYISIDVMRLLVEAGADVNYEDRAFGNLATLAIVHDRYDKAMFLLKNGCRFDQMHESGVPHIIRILKHDIFAPESEKYKEKKAVVEWLRARGVEYHNFPGEFLKEKHRKIWENNPEEWQRWVEYDRNL